METKRRNFVCLAAVRIATVLLLVMGLSACSQPTSTLSSSLNPPAWLQGEWGLAETGTSLFEVTSDNVRMVSDESGTSTTISFGTLPPGNTVQETASGSAIYELELRSDGIVQTHTFERTSVTTLNYTLLTNGTGSTIQLDKR